MNMISKMNQHHFFSTSEKAVIKFILNNPDFLKSATTKDLAKETYTSPSTIVRLAQKLGCEGYSDFKIKFLSEAQDSKTQLFSIDANFPFHKNDSIQSISTNLSYLSIDAIQETTSLINFEDYEAAINILHKSSFIDIYGVGTNQHLAYNFALDMKRINKEVTLAQSHQELIINATYSNLKRASLIISYTGETKEILEYCKILKKSKSPMICITSIGDNSISDLCDITLNIVSNEKMFSKIGNFSSRLSIILALNILYAGVFEKNYDDNVNLSIDMKRKATDFRSKIKPLIEDC